jgi:hypothetical protein
VVRTASGAPSSAFTTGFEAMDDRKRGDCREKGSRDVRYEEEKHTHGAHGGTRSQACAGNLPQAWDQMAACATGFCCGCGFGQIGSGVGAG